MKKILIVEDDQRIALNIRRGLQDEGYETTVAYDGRQGRELALSGRFDLVILDINLPGLSGLAICRDLRAGQPHLPIIMLTALGEVEDRVEGLGLGADDYLVKPFDFRELNARVGVCFRRASLSTTPPEREVVLQLADLTMNLHSKIVSRQSTFIELTAKEFALLQYLLQHQGRVVSKMDLIENVWGYNFDPRTNVVEVYINYLRRKIDKDFEPRLLHTRPGLGYILEVAKDS